MELKVERLDFPEGCNIIFGQTHFINIWILGTGDFVERVLRESGEPLRHRFSPVEQSKRIETILREKCQKEMIELEELRMGSRRGEIPRVRSEIALQLIKELGMSLAKAARLLGVSTSAISKILQRSPKGSNE